MLSHETLIDTVHAGDCLEVMADWPDGLADLCYVAPPPLDEWRWNAAAARRIDCIQRQASGPGHDTVLGLHIALGDVGTMAYLAFVAERLPPLKRVLKPTGSLCMVCDAHVGHYARILLDAYFNAGNFRGEIIWGLRRNNPDAAPRTERIESHRMAAWYVKDDAAPSVRPKPVVPVLAVHTHDDPGSALALAKRVVAATTVRGDVVLDPFCGDGIAAARELGRRAIAINGDAKAQVRPRTPAHVLR